MEELAAMPGFPLRELKGDAMVSIEEFEYLGAMDGNLLLRGSSRMRRMYPLVWMRRRTIFTLDDTGGILGLRFESQNSNEIQTADYCFFTEKAVAERKKNSATAFLLVSRYKI